MSEKFIECSKELMKKDYISAKVIKHPIFMKGFPFKDEEFENKTLNMSLT